LLIETPLSTHYKPVQLLLVPPSSRRLASRVALSGACMALHARAQLDHPAAVSRGWPRNRAIQFDRRRDHVAL